MLEIQVVITEQVPKVIRRAGEKVRVIVSASSNSEDIEDWLTQQLTVDEYQSFMNLWSNDSHPRIFDQQAEYLIIKDKI